MTVHLGQALIDPTIPSVISYNMHIHLPTHLPRPTYGPTDRPTANPIVALNSLLPLPHLFGKLEAV
jgi:hypothetical protein